MEHIVNIVSRQSDAFVLKYGGNALDLKIKRNDKHRIYIIVQSLRFDQFEKRTRQIGEGGR